MSSSVVVVDYGIGNVFSVCNALKKVGAEPELTRDVSKILAADRVILPGVGAFAKAMKALQQYGLDEVLRSFVSTERPFLGICIGMQVLMDASAEFGEHPGLGFIPGRVDRISSIGTDGTPLRVPHICWGRVQFLNTASSDEGVRTLRAGGNQDFYFVHSYHAKPRDSRHVLAVTEYGGNNITAAVHKDNIVGVQFHPERSGPAGLALLESFIAS